MRIVLFHPTVLPPRDYGGVERVVLWLAKGLAELGHDVTVGALAGSRLPQGVNLLAFEPGRVSAHELARTLPGGTEIVHFMAPPEKGSAEALPCPSLLTVHGNGKEGERFPRNTVFLSADHAARHGAGAYVHNGLDPEEYLYDPAAKDGRLVFLSKTSWKVKNVAGAVRLCERARVPLRVAGGKRPLRTRARVAAHSLFGAPPMSWEGPVGQERKAVLLKSSQALVFPVLWPEPFGLVVAEAMISGCPVIAWRRGSLGELITAETGEAIDPAAVDAEQRWMKALADAASGRRWDPARCRQRALEHFHYRRMAADYVTLYAKVVSGGNLNETPPVAKDWRTAS